MNDRDWEFLANWFKGVAIGGTICVGLAIAAYVAVQVWFK